MKALGCFEEVWCADFEFSAPPGHRPAPICLVATELRSGRHLRLWEDQLAQMAAPPFRTDSRALFVAYAAAAEFDQAGPDEKVDDTLVRMAKAQISETFWYATDRGIQFHGGFGFTIDCDMHFYFKRALWSRAMLGDAAHHRRHLAAQLLDD